jgi:hypothetical protein
MKQVQLATPCEQYQGTDGTLWSKDPLSGGQRQAVNVMSASCGLSTIGRCHCRNTALSSWCLVFSDQIMKTSVDCINDKA